MTDKTTVDIHGKDYETVASRVNRFRLDKDHKDLAIRTELVSSNDTYIIMKALIVDIVKNADDARVGEFVLATGYAEEKRDSNNINKTSALENCETSAIGRALAAFGYAGTEYASADEVANAILQQPKQSYTQPVQNNVDNVDPETFKKLCFIPNEYNIDKDKAKQVWDKAYQSGWYRGKYNPATKSWDGTKIPVDALRQILDWFTEAGDIQPGLLYAQFGIDALSDVGDGYTDQVLDMYSDEPF